VVTSFNSRTPGGVRRLRREIISELKQFQFTHPGRGATTYDEQTGSGKDVSIHAPREGCDMEEVGGDVDSILFQFTHPGRGATCPSEWQTQQQGCFNSRTPGGVRHCGERNLLPAQTFQFTHPGRGATVQHTAILRRLAGFNSRTPGGVRRIRSPLLQLQDQVSIHAPREGCDRKKGRNIDLVKFQFTHPGRGATLELFGVVACHIVSIHAPREGCDCRRDEQPARQDVSIHAPREGCDGVSLLPERGQVRFNSRTPGGVRQRVLASAEEGEAFQFTHPGRGATTLTEKQRDDTRSFNSRTPGGVRPSHRPLYELSNNVSIHAPREGCDGSCLQFPRCDESVSIHAPREGCDLPTP